MSRAAWVAALLALAFAAVPAPSHGEYGDVVINKRSEIEGVRPVVFPHWFHRIRYRCAVCHGDLAIKMRAGGNEITMKDIMDGRFCGACHNGQVAWSSERCELCHSGRSGLKTGISGGHRSTGPGVW